LNEFCFEGGCDLTRGTRGKAQPQPAFKVAHLAAGDSFLAAEWLQRRNHFSGIIGALFEMSPETVPVAIVGRLAAHVKSTSVGPSIV